MNDVVLTPEQQAELDAAKKAEEKRLKDEAAALKKQEDAAKKVEAKRLKDEAKALDKANKEAAKAADKAAKEAEKAALAEANKMPVSNGVTRPKPDSLCGKAWSIFDAVSGETQAPATIGASLERSNAAGLNEGNVRAEYARWRKFNGVSGRLVDPAKEAVKAAAALKKAEEKAEKDAKKAEDKRLKAEAKALKDAEEKAAKAEEKRLADLAAAEAAAKA